MQSVVQPEIMCRGRPERQRRKGRARALSGVKSMEKCPLPSRLRGLMGKRRELHIQATASRRNKNVIMM